MEIEVCNKWNPDVVEKQMLGARLGEAFSKTNQILGYVDEIRPSSREKIVEALVVQLTEAVGQYSIHSAMLTPMMFEDLKILKEYPKLQQAIYQYTCNMLDLPKDRRPADEEVEFTSLNNRKASLRLAYYTVKSIIDVLGSEEGTELWRDVVSLTHRDNKTMVEKAIKEMEAKGRSPPTVQQYTQGMIKNWNAVGLANYVYTNLDENKVLFRFDRCLVHDALKDLNDPDVAYLCYCYTHDHSSFNFSRIRMRRTQTLHHGTFCDELYWDSEVEPNPEQPPLKFTKSLGEDMED
ncbi:MAG: L-2-amino-thiazoline-4-carboxylic acid hydrolase [Candidatus Thorarchaeota archaeon]